MALAKMKDVLVTMQDLLDEVNLVTDEKQKVTCVSRLLPLDTKWKTIELLKEFKDFFA